MNRRRIGALCAAWICLAWASAAGAAGWLDSQREGDIAYFLFTSPPSIERYDLAIGQALAPIALSDTPTAFTVDEDGLYISYGRSTVRRKLDGGGETHLANSAFAVTSLAVASSYLYLFYSSTVVSVEKSAGGPIDSGSFFYRVAGVSIARGIPRAFGRSLGVSPADIVRQELNGDGTLGGQNDSPYHGAFPSATKTWVYPDETRVVDSAGVVYTTDLFFAGSLAGPFDAIGFDGANAIVSRGSTLYAYDGSYGETGQYALAAPAGAVYVSGDTAFAFSDAPSEALAIEKVPLAQIVPPQPGEPIDPVGLAYTPDDIEVDYGKKLIYLLSQEHASVFVWSAASRSYVGSIRLAEAPDFMAFSAENARLYFAYASGRITQLDPSAPTPLEQPFTAVAQTPSGLATAGEFVFAVDPSGAWDAHYTFRPDGSLISWVEWNRRSAEFAWSAVNRKLYHFRDGTSPNDLHWEEIGLDGVIGDQMDSPYHSSAGIQYPIRVAPDGSVVLLGSGRVYDATTLEHIDNLSTDIDGAAWLDGVLYTIRPGGYGTEVQQWSPSYAVDEAFSFLGTPTDLFAIGPELVVVTQLDGIPRFGTYHPSGTRFWALLTGGQEVPPVTSSALGLALLWLDGGQTTLTTLGFGWGLPFADVTSAHIHCAPIGQNGPVGVTLLPGPPPWQPPWLLASLTMTPDAGNGCGWTDLGDVTTALRSAAAYINVHTTSEPGGEIRGQVLSFGP